MDYTTTIAGTTASAGNVISGTTYYTAPNTISYEPVRQYEINWNDVARWSNINISDSVQSVRKASVSRAVSFAWDEKLGEYVLELRLADDSKLSLCITPNEVEHLLSLMDTKLDKPTEAQLCDFFDGI